MPTLRRRLHFDIQILGPHVTDLQKTKVQQKANALTRLIEAWSSIQTLYIPGVAALRSSNSPNSEGILQKPEQYPLWLPSSLQGRASCDSTLQEIEWQLRIGQAHDALEELRQALRSRCYMLRFKDRFLRGQGANTRARNCLKAVDVKVEQSAAKYRAAYNAFQELSHLLEKTTSGWNKSLRLLKDEDIRSMTAGTEDRESEGRRRLSWIWIVCGYGEGAVEIDGDEDLQDGASKSIRFISTLSL